MSCLICVCQISTAWDLLEYALILLIQSQVEYASVLWPWQRQQVTVFIIP